MSFPLSAPMRGFLFWGVCIPVRLSLARRGDDPLLRAAAAVIGYRWLSGQQNGPEGVFGGVAFWADDRPVHGMLWSAYAASGRNEFLYADTAFGALNWAMQYLS